jgi:catechol 2,3-dioxygenase-like lactoylglutathione lyase family enzyme
MSITFGHVNIIARDWERLSRFYQDVFDCVPVPPKRNLSGAWLDSGTGISNAHLQGEHLRLPGFGDEGPTLEIFTYSQMLEKPEPTANRLGIGHLAFQVPDVQAKLDRVLAHGGKACGKVVSNPVHGKGTITFVYAADPEGNLIELQSWSTSVMQD